MDQINQRSLARFTAFRERVGWILGRLIDAVTCFNRVTVFFLFLLWDLLAGSKDIEPGSMARGKRRLPEITSKQGNLPMVTFLLRERVIEPVGLDVWPFILEWSMDIALALVSHGFNIDQPYTPYPYSILGCMLQRPDMLMRLLDLGANPNMVTPCGCGDIPSLAAQRASVEVVEMLYHAGAQFFRSNALHRAVAAAEDDSDRFAIMDFLLQNELVDINQLEYGYKANPNLWPRSGTALHYAVKTASLRRVECLLSWEADLNVQNRMGWTPLNLAIKYGLEDIKKVFRDAQQRLRKDTLCRDESTNGRDGEEQDPDADSELSSDPGVEDVTSQPSAPSHLPLV